ncbi:MAG TPA: PEP-CTERM sorting domain-containing protein, partial [Verrucomicrobiae bacterium]|nr:PEP-CTERM sorting domain-containing protein [Verrucomicrobiae bacterium]
GAAFVTPTATFDTFDIGVYTGSEGGYAVNVSSISVVESVPEPGTLALVGVGIAALAGLRRSGK